MCRSSDVTLALIGCMCSLSSQKSFGNVELAAGDAGLLVKRVAERSERLELEPARMVEVDVQIERRHARV
ncbi:hypothetical protein CKK21_26360, partial [Enterobacter cloacae]